MALVAAPAAAHKKHEEQPAGQPQSKPAAKVVAHPMSPAVHEAVKDDLARIEAEAARPWHVRLIDWIGRVHPFAVHFPLALFPTMWVALILARRRGESDALIRALIVVAGYSAALAALLGWINAGAAIRDADPILLVHRWLGTALGLAGAGLALWTWRRSTACDGRAMLVSLGLVTLVLLVQGWLGGALIHGLDHMNP